MADVNLYDPRFIEPTVKIVNRGNPSPQYTIRENPVRAVMHSRSPGHAARVRYDNDSFIDTRLSQRFRTIKIRWRRKLLSLLFLRRVIHG